MTFIDDAMKYKAMIKYLSGRITGNQWLPSVSEREHSAYGVLLRRARGEYVCDPEPVNAWLLAAVQKINVAVAFTMSTQTTDVIFSTIQPHQTDLALPNGSQLQIVNSLAEIASSSSGSIRKFQYAALVREEKLLLVWHDELDKILNHAANIEGKLLAMIWGSTASPFSALGTPLNMTNQHSVVNSEANSTHNLPLDEKKEPVEATEEVSSIDEEAQNPESLGRPLVFVSSVMVGFSVCLLVVLMLGFGSANLVLQSLTDGNFIRMALLATVPIFMLFSMFFAICLFTDLFQLIGPIGGLKKNTRFFSAIKPDLSRAYASGFRPPPMTIQMPVYKESLQGVIIPTVTSLKQAISHYESHGGTASIFINDDGLAHLSEDEARERVEFYHDNNIGWVSRPKHNDDGFIRKGKFKKASNMNFALNISNKVEDKLDQMVNELEKDGYLDDREEERLYKAALKQVLDENPRAKADGNIRVGEFILIVDSDTQVPADCLLYGAAEMYLSPEVAIIQHSTGVMQVSWDYFENGITFFTNLIYSAVSFAVGSGETAPFVGHNAFLRWQAVQSVGRHEENGYIAFWSESHVSEDFDIALRLQIAGNIVRLATYHDNQFKEGVSLTIYDELARWEKYAYGCNELVFNPVHQWLWKSPFTPLFRTFLWSDMQLSSKITILGYISSYYALASGFPLTILNYFLIGWFNGHLDKFYMESWKVFLSLVIVFSLLGNVALAVLRYRLGEKALFPALLENFKWMPMFAVFFGGLPFHLNLAILAHMFKIDMQWGATAKEKENSNFFKEMPKIFNSFKWLYAILVPLVGGMIYLGCFAPRGWEINSIAAIVPMSITLASHALMPLMLNPSLMVFNY
ncbi:hypothetical protein EJ05DRAFT_491960 [Pseudovirgaria hyperparasitica]|uniref:Uncharacterized protein n=1 Tax=Pseudovirgaria hyperparasitica TaxID=470096 RepID=A0A6A6WGY3_9PEZI|nr:uncharacterized protein EJ05DRAFT_491960 [Pseudovirgaria hyperparasitica]KAF2761334.1 hypothetical protein EJ05DRAFT_491960 [Pseudovirgaria hyperparasitica]